MNGTALPFTIARCAAEALGKVPDAFVTDVVGCKNQDAASFRLMERDGATYEVVVRVLHLANGNEKTT